MDVLTTRRYIAVNICACTCKCARVCFQGCSAYRDAVLATCCNCHGHEQDECTAFVHSACIAPHPQLFSLRNCMSCTWHVNIVITDITSTVAQLVIIHLLVWAIALRLGPYRQGPSSLEGPRAHSVSIPCLLHLKNPAKLWAIATYYFLSTVTRCTTEHLPQVPDNDAHQQDFPCRAYFALTPN